MEDYKENEEYKQFNDAYDSIELLVQEQFEANMLLLHKAMLELGMTCEEAAENLIKNMERMGVNLSEIE